MCAFRAHNHGAVFVGVFRTALGALGHTAHAAPVSIFLSAKRMVLIIFCCC
jgi:hypothetical protein